VPLTCLSGRVYVPVTQQSAVRSTHAMMQDYWIEESVKDKSFEDFYERGRELGK